MKTTASFKQPDRLKRGGRQKHREKGDSRRPYVRSGKNAGQKIKKPQD